MREERERWRERGGKSDQSVQPLPAEQEVEAETKGRADREAFSLCLLESP